MPNTTNQKPKSLNFDSVAEIAGALGKLQELRAFTLKSPENEVEARGLAEFLTNSFLNHGEEFLGCWFTVRREYEPFLKAVSSIAYRVRGVMAAVVEQTNANGEQIVERTEADTQAAIQSRAQQPEPANNIITLDQK